MTETYCDRYSAERVEKIETTVECLIWFNNAEHDIKMDLPVTYWRSGYWNDIECEVELPEDLVLECADDFKLDVKISIEWQLKKTLVEPINWHVHATRQTNQDTTEQTTTKP